MASHSEIGRSISGFKEKPAFTLMNVEECHHSPTSPYSVFEQINQARGQRVWRTGTLSITCPQRRTEQRPVKGRLNNTKFAVQ